MRHPRAMHRSAAPFRGVPSAACREGRGAGGMPNCTASARRPATLPARCPGPPGILTAGRPIAINTDSVSSRALAGNHGWLSRNSIDRRSSAYSRYTEPTCTSRMGANGQSSRAQPSTSSSTRPNSPRRFRSPLAAARSPYSCGSEPCSAVRHPLITDARKCPQTCPKRYRLPAAG